MAENLLTRLGYLSIEDCEAVAGAVGVGPSGLITWHSYYRDAARDIGDIRLGFLNREVVIEKLRGLPFWPQAREALRKLELTLEELEARHRCDMKGNSLAISREDRNL